MCRLVCYVGLDEVCVRDVVTAKFANKRGKIFENTHSERLHGFGVAWRTDDAVGALVSLESPLTSLNVRRVTSATRSRVVLAHMRCCGCTSCPAMTYCRSSELNTQPIVQDGLIFAHVGIVAHHLELLKEAVVTRLDDAGGSDSAFAMALLVARYREQDESGVGRLASAVVEVIRELSSGPPSSLNFVVSDGRAVVATRHRSPGDDREPPPLWCRTETRGLCFASSPVVLGAETAEWEEIEASTMIVVQGLRSTQHALAPLLEAAARAPAAEALTEVAPPAVSGTPTPSRAGASFSATTASATTASSCLSFAEAALRAVVAEIVKDRRDAGPLLATEKKRIHARLKVQLVKEADEAQRRVIIAEAVAELRASLKEQNDLALCGAGLDGDLARGLVGELDGDNKIRGSLALLQARLYDSRYDDGAVGGAASADSAGVEEVKDVMQSEARAFRRGLVAVKTEDVVTVLDFGAGDGRFLAEFIRAAREVLLPAGKKKLRIIAYDVSKGALLAFRRRCLRDFGFREQGEGEGLDRLVSREVADDHAHFPTIVVEIEFLVGNALAEPSEVLLPHADMVLSGWGSTSAIPQLVEQEERPLENGRQSAFLSLFATLAPVLVQVVSSANNFITQQREYTALRARRRELVQKGQEVAALDARLRLATREGDLYYTVGEHDYFYSAVTPATERRRLFEAGFQEVDIAPCNLVSFRDIQRSDKLAKLEYAALALVERDDKYRLQRLLALGVAKAARRPLATMRRTPLFSPEETLTEQCSRYIISISTRPPVKQKQQLDHLDNSSRQRASSIR